MKSRASLQTASVGMQACSTPVGAAWWKQAAWVALVHGESAKGCFPDMASRNSSQLCASFSQKPYC